MADANPRATSLPFSFAWDEDGLIDQEDVVPASWEKARANLEEASTYWLGTTTKDGRPHLVPVLAVTVDEALHFCASDRSKKAQNLAADPRCALAGSSAVLDLVVEGDAFRIDDDALLARVADAYRAKYGWPARVCHRGLWAGGAPTAGPPPYRVYRVTPARVFGFPTADDVVPTRWEFT